VFREVKEREEGRSEVRNLSVEEEELIWRDVLGEENKRRVVSELVKRDPQVEWPKFDSKGSSREAAVLVPMVTVEGVPSILFTVRSQHISRHRQLVR